MTLSIIILAFLHLPSQPFVQITEERQTPTGDYLVKPSTALYWDGDIYIADQNEFKVFILHKNGKFSSFGRKGKGPGEFPNYPKHLSMVDGHLIVEEWNRWRASIFDKKGVFIAGEQQDRRVESHGDQRVRTLMPEVSIEKGFRYLSESANCYFCRLEENSYLGVHLSRAFLLSDGKGHLVAFKKSGLVEVFDQECSQIQKMPLPLEFLKAEVAESKLGTAVTKALGGKGTAYLNGTPIISAALKDLNHAWVLVKNENHQEQRFLYEFDIERKEITIKKELELPYDEVTYREGVLLLICSDEAVISAYRIDL